MHCMRYISTKLTQNCPQLLIVMQNGRYAELVSWESQIYRCDHTIVTYLRSDAVTRLAVRGAALILAGRGRDQDFVRALVESIARTVVPQRAGCGYFHMGGIEMSCGLPVFFFFSSRRRHTRSDRDWSSDVCSSDLSPGGRRKTASAPRSRSPRGSVSPSCRRSTIRISWRGRRPSGSRSPRRCPTPAPS